MDETIEDKWGKLIPFASLIAVMAIGIALQKKRECVAKRTSVKFNELWVGAEVMLFVLVGATVNIKYALSFGISTVILIFGVMVFRMVGVFMCLIKTRLSRKERLFLSVILLCYRWESVKIEYRKQVEERRRIWLDLILKKELNMVIDWSAVDKEDYLLAMERSPIKDIEIKYILIQALTDKVGDREVYMKGIDHSYYYEGYTLYKAEDL